MKSSIVKRILAIALIVAGVVTAVLASKDAGSVRWMGLFLLVSGIYFLVSQKASPEQREQAAQQRDITPPIKWYQSPILWVPVAALIIALVSFYVAN
ncbi:hypothetical protein [Pseudidiomarina homiensis]|uniref:Uncharacterized protein n=1 Tax=Pseudidiomarina homiensis TaxID=364198 RepID=A0A432Y3H6_9GAMM|nr:hypothetical protein [Pseudidiomarina homiensis]RUO55461.1 hypothetical protein CWI70_01360 [Pseudidiomarina homiensis]